jgi:hypothetical protein
MDGARGMHGTGEKLIQGCGEKTWRKETAWTT